MFSLFQLLSKEDLRALKKKITETQHAFYAHFHKAERGVFCLDHFATYLECVERDTLVLSYGNIELEQRISTTARQKAWIAEIDETLRVIQVLSSEATLEGETLQALLDEDSPLCAEMEDFSPRPGQQQMMSAVARGISEGGSYVIEAGTGTGKTFAYLIPAVAFADASAASVVVSTATIPLQQQIYEKDLPLIQKALSKNLKVALAKGKTHYLCGEKLQHADGDLFARPTAQRMIAWAGETETGDRSDLPFSVSDEEWRSFSADGDLCVTANCPRRSRCFLRRAKEKVQDAQIVVTNHALLLTDLALKEKIAADMQISPLPDFEHLIFDEAHALYENMRSIFSEQFSARGLVQHLTKIERLVQRHRRDLHHDDEIGIRRSISGLRRSADEMQMLLRGFFAENPDKTALTKEDLTLDQYDALADALENIRVGLSSLRSDMKKTSDSSEAYEEAFARYASLLQKWSVFLRDFEEASSRENYMGRIEKKAQSYPVVISPLEISELVDSYITQQLCSVVFTSASLTSGGSFSYWKRETGLHDAEYLSVPSPFRYVQQVSVYVATDAPEAGASSVQQRYIQDLVLRSLEASRGGALVLFTSYRAMESCYEALRGAGLPMSLLCQGTSSRSELLRRFREERDSVLFGVNSFWAGIDVPGDALRLLIITKLPFENPRDPVLKARCALLHEKNENPFDEIQIPEAVLRFRQGFGRLIRKREDRGVVLICDARIATRSYGKKFLDSLPDCVVEYRSGPDIVEGIRLFFG